MNNDAELTLRGRFGILLSASGGRRYRWQVAGNRYQIKAPSGLCYFAL